MSHLWVHGGVGSALCLVTRTGVRSFDFYSDPLGGPSRRTRYLGVSDGTGADVRALFCVSVTRCRAGCGGC
jgi:hypothetical protein